MTIEKTVIFETMESKGLGIAPFRCIGVYSIPVVDDNNTELYTLQLNAMPKDYGIGSCACCDKALRHNYMVKSSDGKKFVLGSSCIEKLGQGETVSEMKLTKKRLNARVRLIKKTEASLTQVKEYISILKLPVEQWPVGTDYCKSDIKCVADYSGENMRCGVIVFHPIRQGAGDKTLYSKFDREETYQKAMEFITRCEGSIEYMNKELIKLKANAFR
jgi:hypothetical protein